MAILLIITYRSPVLWLVPLTVVGVADRLAAIVSTNVLEAVNVAWDESTVGILSVLVFGAGTDYALLLISRYRDELKTTESRHEAMAHALGRTFEAVLSSATTVVLGLLTLLLSAIPTTRGLGLACAVGVVIAATFALVVLPAALVLFGRWVFWPRVPHVGDAVLVDSRGVWRRVGDAVSRRPRTFVVGDGGRPGGPGHRRHVHHDRPRPGRPVPAEARGHRGRRAAGRVVPGRHQRPRPGPHPGRAEDGPRHGGEGGRRRLGARHQHR